MKKTFLTIATAAFAATHGRKHRSYEQTTSTRCFRQ